MSLLKKSRDILKENMEISDLYKLPETKFDYNDLEVDDANSKRHLNNIADRQSKKHKMLNNNDFKKTMQHFLSQQAHQNILKKTKGS